MNLDQMLASITPEVYENLKYAVETGKWQNGDKLTDKQREDSLQLVLAYQAKIEQSNEQFTIGADGQMVMKSKREIKAEKAAERASEKEIARFNQNDI